MHLHKSRRLVKAIGGNYDIRLKYSRKLWSVVSNSLVIKHVTMQAKTGLVTVLCFIISALFSTFSNLASAKPVLHVMRWPPEKTPLTSFVPILPEHKRNKERKIEEMKEKKRKKRTDPPMRECRFVTLGAQQGPEGESLSEKETCEMSELNCRSLI